MTPTPRSHQLEAIAAIQAHLHTTDRVSVLMACGTGKTLVVRWLAEQRQCATTLVVAPRSPPPCAPPPASWPTAAPTVPLVVVSTYHSAPMPPLSEITADFTRSA